MESGHRRGPVEPQGPAVRSVSGHPRVVPYITAWSSERWAGSGVVADRRRRIGYLEEGEGERDRFGALWPRVAAAGPDRGRPLFAAVHPHRQRRAMIELLCQVCGGPASRTKDGVLWLLRPPALRWPSWPVGIGTGHPPVCMPCAGTATRSCPHLRGAWAALRVREPQVWGVRGTLYRPGKSALTIVQDPVTLPYGDPQIRWTLARQVVSTLWGSTAVDLGTEASRSAPTTRARPHHRSGAQHVHL